MTDAPVVEQRSDEWHRLREGRITGSRMAEAIGVYGSRRHLWRVLTGRQTDTYSNEAMAWGTDFEPLAFALYEAHHNVTVEKLGFVIDDEFDWLGASPDGLVGTDGSIELKCPVGPMYADVPPQYVVQAHVVMRCAKRQWCDLLAWKPEEARIWRVRWSDALWDWVMERCFEFRVYLDTDVEPPAFKRGQKPVLPSSLANIEAPIVL